MTRKLKTLGLAMVAVFAFSAMAANAAQAVDHTFTSNKANTTLTGKIATGATEVFSAGPGAAVECEASKFAGTQAGGTADTVTVTAEYTGCEDTILESEAFVDFNHCGYVFESDTTNGNDAPVTVECETGNQITLTIPDAGVTFHIPAQAPAGGVFYTEEGNDIKVTSTATSIDSTCTGNFTCDLICGFDTACDAGTYNGNSIVSGFEDSSAVSGTNKTTVSSYSHNSVVANLGLTTP